MKGRSKALRQVQGLLADRTDEFAELVSPDDMMHSLSALDHEPLKAFQSWIGDSGRSKKARRC